MWVSYESDYIGNFLHDILWPRILYTFCVTPYHVLRGRVSTVLTVSMGNHDFFNPIPRCRWLNRRPLTSVRENVCNNSKKRKKSRILDFDGGMSC